MSGNGPIEGALALREWALRVLSGETPPRAPVCSQDAWSLFLSIERCALALSAALERAGGTAPLSGEAALALRTTATQELQRVLSARGQLLQIARVAAELEVQATVLKGGVAALGPLRLDLADIDLLVAAPDAERFAARLDRAGYQVTSDRAVWTIATRRTPGLIPVEIHHTVPFLRDAGWTMSALPLEGAPGLHRLAPRDHLHHLLIHTVRHHPERRGCLRDLLLVRHAAAACAPAELQAVRERIGQDEVAEALEGVLDMALELDGGSAPADRFRAPTVRKYVVVRGLDRIPMRLVRHILMVEAAGILASSRRFVDRRDSAFAGANPGVSTFAPVAWLEERVRPLGGAARGFLRVLRRRIANGIAWAADRRARRIERKLTDSGVRP